MKKIIFGTLLLVSSSVLAQQALKLEDIMKGYEFVGNPPTNPFWSWDSKRIYFDWNPEMQPGTSLYYWEKGLTEPKKVPDNEFDNSLVRDLRQRDRKIRFYLKDGTLCSFNTETKKHQTVLASSKSISNLQPGKSPALLYFQQEGNLFKYDATDHSLVQITNFKAGTKSSSPDEENFLESQQRELFQYIRDQDKKKQWNKEQAEKRKNRFPKTYYYGKYELENLQITPDQKFVLFRLSHYPADLETSFEKYVTEDGYAYEEKAREKVSINAISTHKLGIYNLETDSVYFVSFSTLTDIQKIPAYLSLYPNIEKPSPKDRAIVMNEAVFNESGSATLIDVRALDNKDRWIVRLDLNNGKIEELEHQYDPAWIGGPGIEDWDFETGTLGFLKDQESIYFQSEESGYSHLYTLNLTTKKIKALTSGDWEVREVVLSKNKEFFYITANKTHPGNRDYYRLHIESGNVDELFIDAGAHEVQLSPDELKLAIRYSYKNKPWELYVSENKAHAVKQSITHSTTKEFEAYRWREPEVITFQADDLTHVNARLYQPDAAKKNGAAVIFVHGAGYLQNAHNHWSTYLREYMFHNLLADQGFTVLDIDYRGSDGYGRDFRTGIYRYMGGLDLSDQLKGRTELIQKYGIDSTRIGMYGGSYGGFITLMALLNHPGQFKCGAALRSVTDWAHYNQGYTCNILNFPETDPEAYRKSSPIYYAENLQDQLLMLHGMVDDNVQFQDIVRISQRFIELGKKNWELAVFPVEGHGFKESYSWLDEYSRILKLFQENLVIH